MVLDAFYMVKKINDHVKKEIHQGRGRFDHVKKENDQVKLSAHQVTEPIPLVNFKISLVTVAAHLVHFKIFQVKTRFPLREKRDRNPEKEPQYHCAGGMRGDGRWVCRRRMFLVSIRAPPV